MEDKNTFFVELEDDVAEELTQKAKLLNMELGEYLSMVLENELKSLIEEINKKDE